MGVLKRDHETDMKSLGPSAELVGKREEHAIRLAERKRAALESRGAPRRMSEEEKRRALEQMQWDANTHNRAKSERVAAAEKREREQEEIDASMRLTSDQRYFKDIRKQAYMGSEGTIADRLQTQRHRRQKHINDPLEREK